VDAVDFDEVDSSADDHCLFQSYTMKDGARRGFRSKGKALGGSCARVDGAPIT
jgi:hypothetical protein